MTAEPRRWLVEITVGPEREEAAICRLLAAAGASMVSTFRPVSLPATGDRGASLVLLIELASPADAAGVRALPGFVEMRADSVVAPACGPFEVP